MLCRHASAPKWTGTAVLNALFASGSFRATSGRSQVSGAPCKETNMRLLTQFLSAAVLMSAWFSSMPIANAQKAQVEAPSPGLSTPAPGITDEKLDAAAAALERVAILQQTYRQRLAEAAAQTDESAAQADKERIVAEANDALTKAVADQGLSVEEYSSILEVAQNDPEVRGKILQRIRPPQNDRN
jgi:hypothetical protein